MRLVPRVAVLLGFATTAGCATPLSPQSSHTNDADAARNAGGAASRPLASVELKIVGATVTLGPDLQPLVDRRQAFLVTAPAAGPPDTVPAHSVLGKIRWRRVEMTGAIVSDEGAAPAPPVACFGAPPPPSVGDVLMVARYCFTLEPPEHPGGNPVTVTFLTGFTPDTWWAGPDPDRWPRSSDGDGRAVDVTDWGRFVTVPAWPPDGRGYFGPDSFGTIPARRFPPGRDVQRRTFYELYGNRIYARSEGDTVHLNSWIVLVNGGYDKDSPYTPRVVPTDPALPPDFAGNPGAYPLLEAQGLVGSPIGFVTQFAVVHDGIETNFVQSGLYPIFDPLSVFRQPQVVGYLRAVIPGKAYAVVRAQDSDRLLDPGPNHFVQIADAVDAGGGTPEERLLRRKILVFHIRPEPRPQI